MNNFRYNLIIARKKAEFTQKDIANALGITDSCYAHWEQGRTEPRIDFIIKLCALLGVTADFLLGIEPTGFGD